MASLAVSDVDVAVLVHDYLTGAGFTNAAKALVEDAGPLLSNLGAVPQRRPLSIILSEYLRLKSEDLQRSQTSQRLVATMGDRTRRTMEAMQALLDDYSHARTLATGGAGAGVPIPTQEAQPTQPVPLRRLPSVQVPQPPVAPVPAQLPTPPVATAPPQALRAQAPAAQPPVRASVGPSPSNSRKRRLPTRHANGGMAVPPLPAEPSNAMPPPEQSLLGGRLDGEFLKLVSGTIAEKINHQGGPDLEFGATADAVIDAMDPSLQHLLLASFDGGTSLHPPDGQHVTPEAIMSPAKRKRRPPVRRPSPSVGPPLPVATGAGAGVASRSLLNALGGDSNARRGSVEEPLAQMLGGTIAAQLNSGSAMEPAAAADAVLNSLDPSAQSLLAARLRPTSAPTPAPSVASPAPAVPAVGAPPPATTSPAPSFKSAFGAGLAIATQANSVGSGSRGAAAAHKGSASSPAPAPAGATPAPPAALLNADIDSLLSRLDYGEDEQE